MSRETTIHRLDPRTKIVGFIAVSVMLFTFNNPIYVAVIAVGLVGLGSSARSFDNYIRMQRRPSTGVQAVFNWKRRFNRYMPRGDAPGGLNRPEPGLAVLDAIDKEAVSAYQPYSAVRAHLLQRLGKGPEAQHAYERAIGLAEDPAVREFIIQKRG